MRHRCIIRQVLLSASLPLAVLLVPITASADDAASGGKKPAAVPAGREPVAKSDRLRFRSAGACACTCAKGGLREADLKRAEEARLPVAN